MRWLIFGALVQVFGGPVGGAAGGAAASAGAAAGGTAAAAAGAGGGVGQRPVAAAGAAAQRQRRRRRRRRRQRRIAARLGQRRFREATDGPFAAARRRRHRRSPGARIEAGWGAGGGWGVAKFISRVPNPIPNHVNPIPRVRCPSNRNHG